MSDAPNTPLCCHSGRRNIGHKVEALNPALWKTGTQQGQGSQWCDRLPPLFPPERAQGEERVGVGGVRAFGLLVAGIALFCLGISPSFLASATTTGVCCAPVGKAAADAHGEALVRLDYEATSGLLTTPGEEVREGEKLSLRVSVLMSMLVLAACHFCRSGLVLLARNSPLKGGVSHSLGVLGGSWAAACGGVPFLGVFRL